METKFSTEWSNIETRERTFLKECLDEIKRIIITYPSAHLSFGNTDLQVVGDTVYVKVNRNKYVELYSEDGYEKIVDIARWVDIVIDVDKCYRSGRTSYTIDWNWQ